LGAAKIPRKKFRILLLFLFTFSDTLSKQKKIKMAKKKITKIGDRERDRKIWKKKNLFFRRIHFCFIFFSSLLIFNINFILV
jgi:hypothetical protein